MKKIITLLFIGMTLNTSWGQVDTLYEENLRKVADLLFQNLDSTIYGPSLLNRSFSVNPVFGEQLNGNYNQIHTIHDLLLMYQEIAFSYVDSTYMMDIPDLASFIENVFIDIDKNIRDSVDELTLPFGVVYHYVSALDSIALQEENYKIEEFTFIPMIPEEEAYTKVLVKSAAILDFYPDNGYVEGYIKFIPELISFSPDIFDYRLTIDVGQGFVNFDEKDSLIAFDRDVDSVVGKLAISFTHDNITKYDTILFYVVARGETTQDYNKNRSSFWDVENGLGVGTNSGVTMWYAVKYGCGNVPHKTRRPVIIVPPYRPSIQPVSFETYYHQFNFANMLDMLHEMGYDIFFIKQAPGNASLEAAAETLITMITNRNLDKEDDYPDESWENIVIGFSMGGQIARYALKKMEYEHMENNGPHHHTRLYIPFDSPHLGANIPMFTQFVYQDLKNLNIFAHFSYNALVDEASKDMGICHILGSSFTESGNLLFGKTRFYTPGVTSERYLFVQGLQNWYNHEFTPLDDLRRTYPTFTRNVAVSVGKNDQNYTTEYELEPGMKLYGQTAIGIPVATWFLNPGTIPNFTQIWNRGVWAANYSNEHRLFRNSMVLITPIPIVYKNHHYRLNYGFEWDMAQGGYKNEFWDKNGQIANISLVPVGVVPILNNFGFLNNQNNKLYFDHMSFLPLVSSLHINPSIWQNNNLFFNPKDQGLMYNKFGFDPVDDKSNTYGYPNLGHPDTHFSITPFEAIYCDNQTYEHIKMQATIDEDQDLNPIYLVHTRNFVVNEIESDVVYLQNKIIGKNHVQGVPSYKYRAWYKAYTRIEIGNLVTPKTDPGDYVIEATGDITVYAGESIILKPGFHAQNGSTFHAFIKQDCAQPPMNVPVYITFQEPENTQFNKSILAEDSDGLIEQKNTDENKISIEDYEPLVSHEPVTLDNENKPDEPSPIELTLYFAVRNDDEP